MAVIFSFALLGILLVWLAILVIRLIIAPRTPDVERLEARYRRAIKIGDVSEADQIEAELRDIPRSA